MDERCDLRYCHPCCAQARVQEGAGRRALQGGAKRTAKQHEKDKLTARERIELLLNQDSFREYDMLKSHRCSDFGMGKQQFPGDGIITGHQRPSYVCVQPGLHHVHVLNTSDNECNEPNDATGSSSDRSQRLWWCSHPRRRGVAHWIRRHLPAERARRVIRELRSVHI